MGPNVLGRVEPRWAKQQARVKVKGNLDSSRLLDQGQAAGGGSPAFLKGPKRDVGVEAMHKTTTQACPCPVAQSGQEGARLEQVDVHVVAPRPGATDPPAGGQHNVVEQEALQAMGRRRRAGLLLHHFGQTVG